MSENGLERFRVKRKRSSLGILAGGGSLPRLIAQACRGEGRDVLVIAFEGETDPATCAGVPHRWLGLGAVGALLKALRQAGCREVVLAGSIRRPSLSTLKPDLRGMRLMGRIASARGKGDDALLSLVIAELEREGFTVVGADDLIAALCAPAGAIGQCAPDADDERDIAIGIEAARALGAQDIGQAVVVQAGRVLGVEGAEGTDRLIERCAALQQPGPGAVLVKMKKPGQERRADLPAIGAATIERIAGAGFRGVAVEAGETLLLERARAIARADALGVFVVGVSR